MAEISPTDRELEALKVLWERRAGDGARDRGCDERGARGGRVGAGVHDGAEPAAGDGAEGARATHERDGKAYVYLPRVERQSIFRRLAGGFLEKVFDGAVDEYLVHALESKRLSAKETRAVGGDAGAGAGE